MSLTRLLSNKIAAGRAVKLTTIMFAAAFTLTACGGGEHEVKAVDKLDEAAELAKANAPEHEFLSPEDIAPAAAAPDAAAAGTDAATDGAAATDPAAGEATATGTTTEAPATDAAASTAAPAEATTATDATAAQPADQKEAAAQ